MYPAISTVNNCSGYRQDLNCVFVDQFVPFLWAFVGADLDAKRRQTLITVDWCIVQYNNQISLPVTINASSTASIKLFVRNGPAFWVFLVGYTNKDFSSSSFGAISLHLSKVLV